MEVLLAVGETLLFGISAHLCLRYQTEQAELQKLFAFIQKAEPLTPGQAIRVLSINDSTSKDLKDIIEGQNFIKGTGLFKGFVGGDHFVSGLLNSSVQLVMSELSLEQLLSNSRIYEEVEGKKEVAKVNEFLLIDPKDPGTKMSVDNGNKMRCYEDSLSVIRTEEHCRKLSLSEKMISWLMFSLKLFLSVNNFGKKVSGFSIGIRRIERGILLGQFLTIFGDFVFDSYNKKLRIVNPLYFMKEKDQLLRHLQDANMIRSRNMTLVFGLMALFGFLLVKRLLKLSKGVIQKHLQQFRQRTLDSFYRISSIEVSNVHCMKCHTNPRSVVFKPCLHLAVCWLCDSKMGDRSCPQCRAHIDESVNVFIV